ncbi:hypothetical protein E2C01_100773 [Portunus trituberculatus]|uniref:Uncharacterized protein n=1 Tax=Portunus trituberculatus TaxID=210409 RepID=A0A5B7K7S6_PORTR|nr:hypothetical protein [Portunus trituberculatus]
MSNNIIQVSIEPVHREPKWVSVKVVGGENGSEAVRGWVELKDGPAAVADVHNAKPDVDCHACVCVGGCGVVWCGVVWCGVFGVCVCVLCVCFVCWFGLV